MTKRARFTLVFVLIAALAAVAVLLSFRPQASSDIAARTGAVPDPVPVGATAQPLAANAAPPDPEVPVALGSKDGDIAAYLRDRYGRDIDRPYIQIRMLEELIRYFQKQNPENWREPLLAALRAAFPDLYEQLAANLQRRLDYGDWMKQNRAALQARDPEAQRAAIWDKRTELFGAEAAEQIWAAELKNQAVAAALATIDAHEGGVADKLTMYKQALEGVYEDGFDRFLQQHRHQVMNQFFAMESVQQGLGGMSPEDRSQTLHDIRRAMGLDGAALARWGDLDEQRDKRWENGLAYMQERSALVARYGGAELEQKLDALRTRYFGAEGDTIKLEEQAGVFRFGRERRWGQN
jgi:hypothetical protein